MHTLLIHFQSGSQVRTSHSSSQSRWLPQLCDLRNSLSNRGKHWSFHVYSSVTTVPEGLFTGHLYSSISSTSASTEHCAIFFIFSIRKSRQVKLQLQLELCSSRERRNQLFQQQPTHTKTLSILTASAITLCTSCKRSVQTGFCHLLSLVKVWEYHLSL